MTVSASRVLVTVALVLCVASCSNSERASDSADPTEKKVFSAVGTPAGDDILSEREIWFGDLDEMVERRRVRALVVFSKSLYFLDGAKQRGISYEGLQLFEKHLNEMFKTDARKINVLIIPVGRNVLLEALNKGWGDIAVANLTVTPEREKIVDFSSPLITDGREVVVTGPSSPSLKTLDDLAGETVLVRKSSSYWSSLVDLNERLAEKGLKKVKLQAAPEDLEDEDLLEMVNAGLAPIVVVDQHKADFWVQIFKAIEVHSDLILRSGGHIAWAVRQDTPQLLEVVNDFTHENRKGTLMGNILFKRYLEDTQWVTNSMSRENLERFESMAEVFERYAGEYDFDWLMVIAQAYQESELDHSKRSRAGAIGVMQLLESTARDPNVAIPEIKNLEDNVHAGTKYLRFIRDRYFENEPMSDEDKTLFSFAAYNAGPARVAGLRKKAEEIGLDPNQWFDHVEVVAAHEIGRETVQYVANIFKYYIAYRQIALQVSRREQSWSEQGN